MKKRILIITIVVLLVLTIPTAIFAESGLEELIYYQNSGKFSTTLNVGESTQIVSDKITPPYTYTKYDQSIVSVSSSGEVTAKKAGKTTIVFGAANSGIIAVYMPITVETGNPNNISDASVSLSKTSYKYGNGEYKPSVTVKYKGKKLTQGTHYSVSYSNNKWVGTATVKITGKGSYTGTVTKTFKINPKGTTIKTPKATKKAFTAKWSKQSAKMSKSRITGYQVRYSLKKDFKSDVKKKSVKGYEKTSVKISKLKAKKTYYVQVRTYMKVDGKTYYSPWSKTKSVKTK